MPRWLSMTWTRADILDAIDEWVELRGRPPTVKDWKYAQRPFFPSVYTVCERFGNLGNAIEEAGHKKPGPGRPRTKVSQVELLHLARAAEVPYDVIAGSRKPGVPWRRETAAAALRAAPPSPLRDFIH